MDAIIEVIGKVLLSGIVAMVVHEGGHSFMARLYKRKLHFKLKFGKLFKTIPVPRGVWQMPFDISRKAQRNIAMAGFGTEFLVAAIFVIIPYTRVTILPYYGLVALLHLVLYKFYAGNDSDFRWF